MTSDFQVGDWLVRPDLNAMERAGVERSLEPKVMDVLIFLVQHAGEVLPKERIITAVWPDTFVTDDALKYAIVSLRKAFGDDSKNPSYIQTIARRGYRLVAEVRFVEEEQEPLRQRYRVLEKIGEGGMGEVCLAEDVSLGRKVALKFLPFDLREDPIALRRFEREAKAAAALDHPFICKVYETGQLDERAYIALEYVEGETLKERLERGALPAQRALKTAREIAEALAKAHSAGIIHRDLKPANIILGIDGHIKITDFGLAKRIQRSVEGGEDTITVTLTREGSTVGTLAYMSPEQLKGDPVDMRSDIFSFGVVLQEMVTGAHPFRKPKPAETSAAIIEAEPPPLSHFQEDLPEGLQDILFKILAKDPNQRQESIAAVQKDLKNLALRELVLAPAGRGRKGSRRFRLAVVLLLLLFVLLGAFFWGPWVGVDQRPAGPLQIRPFTTDGGRKWWPRFSPDGEKVAYNNTDGNIYVKGLGSGFFQLTDDPDEDLAPAWSPDGKTIAYTHTSTDFRFGAIYTIPSMGGKEQKLVDYEGVHGLLPTGGPTYFLYPVSWSPDGDNLIYSESESPTGPARVVRLKIATREKEFLTDPREGILGDLAAEYSPDGKEIALLRSSSKHYGKIDVWLMPVQGGVPRRLTEMEYDEGGRPSWTPDGRSILFTAQKGAGLPMQLWRVDVETGRRNLVPGISGGWHTSASGNRLVFQKSERSPRNIWRLPVRNAVKGEEERFIHSSYDDQDPSYSPDGKEIAFVSSRSGSLNIFKCDSDGSNARPLTRFDKESRSPSWSPDGSQIAFQSYRSGNWDIWLMDSEGLNRRALTDEPSNEVDPSWSRDGKWIYFTSGRGVSFRIYKKPVEGGTAVPVAPEGSFGASESRDGEFVYYNQDVDHSYSLAAGKGWQVPVQLWRLRTSGGSTMEKLVLPKAVDWMPGRGGIYYTLIELEENEGFTDYFRYSIHFLDTGTGLSKELFSKSGTDGHAGLTVSPEEDCLLFTPRIRSDSLELMIAENFR